MRKLLVISAIVLAAASFASCEKQTYGQIFAPDELGAKQKEFYVEATGGIVDISLLANKPGSVSTIGECPSWFKLSGNSFENDSVISVTLDENKDIQRHVNLVLATDTRRDTICVYQYGAIEEIFYVPASSVIVYNGKGENTVSVITENVPVESIGTVVACEDGEWIKSYSLTKDGFSFVASDNEDPANMRRAYVYLSHLDGWGKKQVYGVTLLQARKDNNIGSMFNAEKLHEVASEEGYVLPEDAIIEGYIVSTTETGQAGEVYVEDYKQGTGVVNSEKNDVTSYFESLDGKYGFKLIATSAEANDFDQFERVILNVDHAVVTCTSTAPVRYTITGVSCYNVLSKSDGSYEIPQKIMSMSELCDDDIYTYVTLKDCEIPMRKGPFTPVNEGYTPACGYNRYAKHAMLMRDKEGSSMYMFINMACSWRRNGKMMPYGSGDVSGVIVHEDFKSFEKDGNIGNYQIRPFFREDLDLAEDFNDSFSGLITEFRYAKFPGEFEETYFDNAILATYGNGEMCHTYGAVGNFSDSFFYIGQSGSKFKNKYTEGIGVVLEDGSQYPDISTIATQNTDGKGWFKSNLSLSWSNKYWWDSENDRGYCWLVKFSTAGISSDKVSMQFAMYNNSQSARSPRYWKAQYSLTTSSCAPSDDDQWSDIGEFTVHDVPIWASQNDWQTLATRVYDFPLPTEILGHDEVFIRLTPRNNKAAAKSETSYDSSTIGNGSGYNTMDYFAVRYNK